MMARLWLVVVLTWALAPLAAAQTAEHTAVTLDDARLEALLEDQAALEAALDAARSERIEAGERRDALEAEQASLGEARAALEAGRSAQAADLEGVAQVLDRHLGELRDSLASSWLTLNGGVLPARSDAHSLPSPARLEAVAAALVALTADSARVERATLPVAGADGRVTSREVIRLGDMAAFSDADWLRRESPEMPPAVVEHTPREAAERLAAFARGEGSRVMLDPTGGRLLDALAQRPTLIERFHQGGAVGYVVVTLGGLGLLVALFQYAYLLWVGGRLRRQRRDLDALRDDNPLGRVLGKYRALREGQAPEALEARLDEALLAELPRLERGQSLVKLLAAVAPLLGLLGTVTGMIVTFQAITVFGTGDPQLMAGGISQALVTTVLGLITAVPLLFAHTALVSRSRRLSDMLEGQASAALAEHLERQPADDARHGSRHAAAYV
ncbi:flagellar motor protein MotA [Halomonas sp. 1513]|nr:MotA/TolQ/ExbB proton channel family protein [Halomonas sp. 1513]APX93571.1 flagellar motor protein MotA [Halomonas sp. 1513]